jgi:DNA polymerase III epsilon subunit-like protein
MYLFFDTETTGLPANWKAPVTDTNNWPRVTQLAWQVYDQDGNLLSERCDLIKPDGWVIPDEEFFRENNMSTERCEREGVPLAEILKDFVQQVDAADYLVAHNMAFDEKVIGCEMVRMDSKFREEPKKICTMQESTDYCRMQPFKWGKYKWPSLLELHKKLFDEGFDGAHDALADVSETARCFFKLKEKGVLLKG